MKTLSKSIWSGLGIIALLLVGCSGSDQVAENSSSQDSRLSTNDQDGQSTPGRGQNNDKDEYSFSAKPNSGTGTASRTPEVGKTDVQPRNSKPVAQGNANKKPARGAQPIRKEQPKTGMKKDSGDESAADGAGAASASAGTGSVAKRKVGAPAEPTGKVGTNPGDTLPGIEGKDVDGIEFSLSDYDGKVKMVDFWGDW